MMADLIRYDLLTQKALRGVVREVLGDVARKKVLPGEHHFYISFDTQAEGVAISSRLLAQYPEEMTIILQHQFWDLKVGEDGFEVGLSFGGVPEHLVVPFAAINGFFDPSVQFGLQFEQVKEGGQDNAKQSNQLPSNAAPKDPLKAASKPPRAMPPAAGTATPGVKTRPAAKTEKPVPEKPAPAKPAQTKPEAGANEAVAPKPAQRVGAEVVSLDRFRKK
ncbi:MAG: Stringent starvation protein B [Pseudolabrys sp.]|nr:Stringent starvation protein B [Pseudolabrys sp.]